MCMGVFGCVEKCIRFFIHMLWLCVDYDNFIYTLSALFAPTLIAIGIIFVSRSVSP